MKCLRRPLVAVPPPRKLNSAREIERGNSTRFVAALLPRGSEFHFLLPLGRDLLSIVSPRYPRNVANCRGKI